MEALWYLPIRSAGESAAAYIPAANYAITICLEWISGPEMIQHFNYDTQQDVASDTAELKIRR